MTGAWCRLSIWVFPLMAFNPTTLLDIIGATLAKGDKLLLVGFGTFDIRKRAERPGRNPQTGEPIVIAEAVLPQFSPGKLLKDRVAESKGGSGEGKGTAGKPSKGGKGSKL